MKSIRDKFETCSGPGSEIRLKTSEKISKRLIKRLKERKKIMVMFGIMTVAVVAFAVGACCLEQHALSFQRGGKED